MIEAEKTRFARECRDNNKPRAPAASVAGNGESSARAAGNLLIRFATAQDIENFYGERPGPTLRAIVAELDGAVVGIVGIARRGTISIFFSEIRPALRPHLRKMSALRKIKRAVNWVQESALPVFAIAQDDEPDAPRLLTRLGFEQVSEDLYRWHS